MVAEEHIHINAASIDSGNCVTTARRAWCIPDAADCSGIAIFRSGNMGEYAVRKLLHGAHGLTDFVSGRT